MTGVGEMIAPSVVTAADAVTVVVAMGAVGAVIVNETLVRLSGLMVDLSSAPPTILPLRSLRRLAMWARVPLDTLSP